MTARLKILKAGPGVTVQDGGRHGALRWGVTTAGPMDRVAFAIANLALGNPIDNAAIEISLGGVEAEVDGPPLAVAVVAPGFEVIVDGQSLPSYVILILDPGQHLVVRPGERGAWGYLALGARIDLPLVLGSLATHIRSGFGGFEGRGLRALDALPLKAVRNTDIVTSRLLIPVFTGNGEPIWPELTSNGEPIRVVLGPQDDYFAPDQITAFLEREWTIGPRSDRMAYALEGVPLRHAKGYDIVSDGVAFGAIQVPGSGLPFVLLADRQPTGGYPKIATVISADYGRLAQQRPGARVRFVKVTMEEAVAARREVKAMITGKIEHEPLTRMDFSSPFLLSRNLVSGVVDMMAWERGGDDLW